MWTLQSHSKEAMRVVSAAWQPFLLYRPPVNDGVRVGLGVDQEIASFQEKYPPRRQQREKQPFYQSRLLIT